LNGYRAIQCSANWPSRITSASTATNGLDHSRVAEGDYEFAEDGIRGTFAGHGVRGEFSFEIGNAAVTITDKPFWLPEVLLKQKIAEGLDTFCNELE
jgi:hypothetical protein